MAIAERVSNLNLDGVEVAKFLVTLVETVSRVIRGFLIVYAAMTSSMVALIVLRDQANLTPEAVSLIVSFRNGVGFIILCWPVLAATAYLCDQLIDHLE